MEHSLIEPMLGFFAAVIGGLVAGLFSLIATNRTIRQENERERRHEDREIQNLLDSLHVEVSTLWGFHMRRIGAMIENLQPGQSLDFYYPLTQDYFTIYNTNASKIGGVADPMLRECIVVCYNKCKKVVDGFKYNNVLFSDHRDLVNIDDGSPQLKARIDSKRKELTEYALMLQEDHYELKDYVHKMLTALEERKNPVNATA